LSKAGKTLTATIGSSNGGKSWSLWPEPPVHRARCPARLLPLGLARCRRPQRL